MIDTLDLKQAVGVLAYFLARESNAYSILGFNNQSEAFNKIGEKFFIPRNTVKNYRDAFDPYTDSNRAGWHQRETLNPSHLQDVYDKCKDLSDNDLVQLSKSIMESIWLPELGDIWKRIENSFDNLFETSEYKISKEVKNSIKKHFENKLKLQVKFNDNSISLLSRSQSKSQFSIIPNSMLPIVYNFKSYLKAFSVYINVANNYLIDTDNNTEELQKIYNSFKAGSSEPRFKPNSIPLLNSKNFIKAIRDVNWSGLDKSIFRADALLSVCQRKLNLVNDHTSYIRYLIDYVLSTDINLDEHITEINNNKSLSASGNFEYDGPRNIVFYGAPGTGKSYTIKEGFKDFNSHIVVFFSEYQNADFIGSIRPVTVDGKINYKFKEGPFLIALKDALKNPDKGVVLIIEELNRGDAAAIFGNYFQLLDRDENGQSEYAISIEDDIINYLSETSHQGNKLKLPGNFIIAATMNNSDQSVFPLDTAFKRRWAFEYIPISFEEVSDLRDGTTKKIEFKNNGQTFKLTWSEFAQSINHCLQKARITEDRLLGPFFLSQTERDSETMNEIISSKVLIYLWDDVLRHESKNIIFTDEEKLQSFSIIQEEFNQGNNVFSQDLLEQFGEKLNDEIPDNNDTLERENN